MPEIINSCPEFLSKGHPSPLERDRGRGQKRPAFSQIPLPWRGTEGEDKNAQRLLKSLSPEEGPRERTKTPSVFSNPLSPEEGPRERTKTPSVFSNPLPPGEEFRERTYSPTVKSK
jgi:hypothetical protein